MTRMSEALLVLLRSLGVGVFGFRYRRRKRGELSDELRC